MSFLKKIEAAKKSPFDEAAKFANKGHYLDRIIGIAKAFKYHKGYIDLLEANRKFLQTDHQPAGLDELIDDVGAGIIYTAKELKPTPEDWKKIVWGLPYNPLKREGLLKYRLDGDSAKKSNQN